MAKGRLMMYKTINEYGIVYEWDDEYYYQKALKNGHKPYNDKV